MLLADNGMAEERKHKSFVF